MIVDLERFVAAERPYWGELERLLHAREDQNLPRMNVDEAQRFFYLYERCSADLTRLTRAAADPALQSYVESLVARAYGEIHEVRREHVRAAPLRWVRQDFPRAFRRRWREFALAVAITIAGCVFGAVAVATDSDARAAIMPFPNLLEDPRVRVQKEENPDADRLSGHKSEFSAHLMTHNTRVAIFTMALGVTFGIGTIAVLFYNGVVLGAVILDYVRAGQSAFLGGWLLPHGAIEIPAILIAGQAGLLLAGALIGWRSRESRSARLRRVAPDLVALVAGAAVMLVWAGIVEAFLSQYHHPVVPYSLKMLFGAVELSALALYLGRSGTGVDVRP